MGNGICDLQIQQVAIQCRVCIFSGGKDGVCIHSDMVVVMLGVIDQLGLCFVIQGILWANMPGMTCSRMSWALLAACPWCMPG